MNNWHSLPQTFLGLYVLLDIPIQFILALMVLLILGLPDVPHLLVVVEVVPVVG